MFNKQTISLGIINPKSAQNMGSILRAAGCFGVSSVFYTGNRYGYARQFRTDTHNASDKIPVVGCPTLQSMKPKGAKVVAVELIEGATALPKFAHPQNAFYLFGPEDGSIKADTLSWCDECVYIPTDGCLNLAASVNILLYDRLAKQPSMHLGDELIRHSRDNNNRSRLSL